ncbi:type VI secretion protein [Streptomyces rectiverticillatus]|uniref:type VI secretion protein n=1 Tax=Streptomyces rectiverticillatus TaxID=173860 RepID=UPI0015C35C51|nr:type VI secretion protein [Streptomyces rectiverticillatus]QLE73339.1 type VI secretion protein [Streptomyces rectiverticillatus]
MGERRPERGIPDGMLMAAIVLLLGMTLLVWATTGLAALFAHGAWPEAVTLTRTPLALRHLVTQPRDLPAAWPDTPAGSLSGYGLFWGLMIGELLVLVVLGVFVVGTVARWKAVRARRRADALALVERPRSASGAAPGSAADQAAGQAAAGPAIEQVAPSPVPVAVPAPRSPRPADPVGAPASGPLASGALAPGVFYGADRGDIAAQAVLEAAGPVLVTTSDAGLWSGTKDARAKLGPVHVFDPSHLLDTPDRLRWSPVAGCTARETAAARAAALLAPVRPLSALDSATADTAETLLRCWLHAAAVDGRPFRQVLRWAQGTAAHEPVRILRTHVKAAGGAAGELESALTGHPQRREVAQELTARALGALSSVHVRDACNPNRTDSLTWESFVAEGGTLYVVGEAIEDPRTRPGAMPLLTALVSSVVERGRGMAGRSSAGRLDPPLTLVLDDVAAVAPAPALPDLVAEGTAQGLPTFALMRSEEQARARWPHRALVG